MVDLSIVIYVSLPEGTSTVSTPNVFGAAAQP